MADDDDVTLYVTDSNDSLIGLVRRGYMSRDGRLWWGDDYKPRSGEVPVYTTHYFEEGKG